MGRSWKSLPVSCSLFPWSLLKVSASVSQPFCRMQGTCAFVRRALKPFNQFLPAELGVGVFGLVGLFRTVLTFCFRFRLLVLLSAKSAKRRDCWRNELCHDAFNTIAFSTQGMKNSPQMWHLLVVFAKEILAVCTWSLEARHYVGYGRTYACHGLAPSSLPSIFQWPRRPSDPLQASPGQRHYQVWHSMESCVS